MSQTDGQMEPDDTEGGDDGESTTLAGIFVFLVIGGALVSGGLYLQAQQPGPGETDPIEATVIESDYGERGSGSDREFTIRVTYEYTVDGQTYRSSNVQAGPAGYTVDTRQRAELLVNEQYAAGNTVEAQYDPDDPETAYLIEYKRGAKIEEDIGHYLLIGFGGLAILASVVSLLKKVRRRV